MNTTRQKHLNGFTQVRSALHEAPPTDTVQDALRSLSDLEQLYRIQSKRLEVLAPSIEAMRDTLLSTVFPPNSYDMNAFDSIIALHGYEVAQELAARIKDQYSSNSMLDNLISGDYEVTYDV